MTTDTKAKSGKGKGIKVFAVVIEAGADFSEGGGRERDDRMPRRFRPFALKREWRKRMGIEPTPHAATRAGQRF